MENRYRYYEKKSIPEFSFPPNASLSLRAVQAKLASQRIPIEAPPLHTKCAKSPKKIPETLVSGFASFFTTPASFACKRSPRSRERTQKGVLASFACKETPFALPTFSLRFYAEQAQGFGYRGECESKSRVFANSADKINPKDLTIKSAFRTKSVFLARQAKKNESFSNPDFRKPKKNNHDLLLNRFSNSFIGKGKKERGYTFFVKSLAIVRKLPDSPFKKINSLSLTSEAYKRSLLRDSTNRPFSLHTQWHTKCATGSFFNTKIPGNGSPSQPVQGVCKESKSEQRIGKSIENQHTKSFAKQERQAFYKIIEGKPNRKRSLQPLAREAYKLNLRVKSNSIFCREALDFVKPVIETRKLRKGRATFQVPFITQSKRQLSLALRSFVLSGKRKRKSYPNGLIESFAHILKNSHSKLGESVEKKNNLYKLGADNRAYINLRWW